MSEVRLAVTYSVEINWWFEIMLENKSFWLININTAFHYIFIHIFGHYKFYTTVNSGGYIHHSSPPLWGIVVLVFNKSDG